MDETAQTNGNPTKDFTVDGKTYTLADPGFLEFKEEAEAFITARRPK